MTTIVIPYLHSLSQGEELKMAIRSWCKFAKFDFSILLIGDKPDWYVGDHIQTVPIRGIPFARAYDIHKKLSIVVAQQSVSMDFVYSYDDVYLVKDTRLDVLKKVIALEPMPEDYKIPRASNKWIRLLKDTVSKLGYQPVWNYETHIPRMFNKIILAELIEAYSLQKNPLLFSTLYYNEYFCKPDVVLTEQNDYKAGIYEPMAYGKIKDAIKGKHFLNHSENAYKQSLIRVLRELYPEKCRYEL